MSTPESQEDNPGRKRARRGTAVLNPAPLNYLKRIRNNLGLTADQVATELGISIGAYYKLENGEREIKTRLISRMAEVFGITPAEIVTPPVSIIGEIAGDGEVQFYHYQAQGLTGGLSPAPTPPQAGPGTHALVVKGEGLTQAGIHNNWLVYFSEPWLRPSACLNRVCLVSIPHDQDQPARCRLRRLVAHVGKHYTLATPQNAVEKKVTVSGACPISWYRPRDPTP